MLQSRIRRGEMDRQVLLIKKVIATNSFNEDKEEGWEAVAVNPLVWARMRQAKGREVAVADRINYVQETIFTMDYRTDISEVDFRVVFREKPYNIISVTPNEESRDMYIDVICQVVDDEIFT